MDEMIYLCSRYLSEICHCYADEIGNYPCDNGAICDRCDQQEISFNEWRLEQMFWDKEKLKRDTGGN